MRLLNELRKWLWRRKGISLGLMAALVLTATMLLAAGSRQEDEIAGIPTARVTRGTLLVSINETGEIQSENRKVIANELPLPAVILEVVEEGRTVEAGEVILRLECKQLLDEISTDQLAVSSAENSFIQAKENIELTQQKVDNEVRKAQNTLVDAESDLRKFLEHEWPTRVSNLQSSIKLAESDLTLARDRLSWKKKINEDPELNSPYSANEIAADELAVERLELRLSEALSNLQALNEYDLPKEERARRIAVEDAKLALHRAEVEARTQMLMAQANLMERQRHFQHRTDRLNQKLAHEQNMVITADRRGLIVYDTASRWNPVTVAVGEQVNSRQQLMVIPDMTSLRVMTKVYEGAIQHLRLGMSAYIRLDSRPDEIFTGRVSKMAVLPDSQNRWWDPSYKVFPVQVTFDRLPDNLKPGATAQVELILAELHNVLSAPISAVFTEQEQTFCWRVENGRAVRTAVQVGRMNESRVEIVSGLNEGDVVLLAAPPGASIQGAPKHVELPTRQPSTQPAASPEVGGQEEADTSEELEAEEEATSLDVEDAGVAERPGGVDERAAGAAVGAGASP